MRDEALLEDQQAAAEQMAQLLGIGANELLEALGGPWLASLPVQPADPAHTAFFVGRAGDSVAMNFDIEAGVLTVGKASGEWVDLGLLAWVLKEPKASFDLTPAPNVHAISEAVEAAYRSKRRSLKICRYCGELLGRENMFDDEHCYGCASRFLGVVY